MTKIQEVDLIKMENGKKDLPVGVTRSKHSYRIHRTIAGKKYNFGSIQNLELALKMNSYIEILVKDYRAELDRKVSVEESLIVLLAENSASDMVEITRQFDGLTQLIEDQNDKIQELESVASVLINELKTFRSRSVIEKLFNR